jgi:hypothetical protein
MRLTKPGEPQSVAADPQCWAEHGVSNVDHSYEEIRAAALDVLAGREKSPYEPNQYGNLAIGVAETFARREQPAEALQASRRPFQLAAADSELFLEVFWDLFRQGIITLGYNDSNREFPFCRVSRLGERLIRNQDTYFFHDVTAYSSWLRREVPAIDPVTLLYVQEALQAFQAGCILSSTVMLGVATEHMFLLLVEAVDKSANYAKDFAAVGKERTILHKVNKFRHILAGHEHSLSAQAKEDLDTHFAGILSVIRAFRNQAGHPTGQLVDREQAYVLLRLFIPYCRKMYQLREELGR